MLIFLVKQMRLGRSLLNAITKIGFIKYKNLKEKD